MMTQAFYTGINGIQTQQQAIDIVSDNISNVSTIGFRGYATEFSSLFENKLNTTSSSSSTIGVGSRVSAVTMNENKGAYQLSDRSTDLALLGDGWFAIQGEDKPIYTRDGSFSFDSQRDLVTADGYHVLGTMGGNINGEVLSGQLAEIQLGNVDTQQKLSFPEDLLFPSEATTTVKFLANLGTEDVTRVVSAGIIDGDNNKNKLRLEFNRTIPQVLPGTQWDITATTENLEGTEVYSTTNGIANFAADGSFISSNLSQIGGIQIDFGSGYDGLKITNLPFSGTSLADGEAAGELVGYDINQNGEIVASFTNGKQSAVGKIAVYHFANNKGLERVSGSRFAESVNSGEAIFYKDENGNNILGTEITNYKLEGSNVRMEVALTEVIIMQRAFDANSKSITTADEMLQKALNMGA
ncbi:MAG: flagellar hook protein FlgE [Sulfurimonas sp.]|nr:flagellar hook protein FlgE [Sulfurimonas sp.]